MEHHDPLPQRQFAAAVRNLWRLAIPFWRFRDAGRGTIEQRIANYRYNRAQRKILPFYVWKWVGIAACMFQIMRVLSDLMAATAPPSGDNLCATLFCMGAGIGFAFSCVVIILLTSTWLFLTCVEK